MVTAQRFAQGMTFDEYVKFIGTPENLKREGSMNLARKDWTGFFRKAYEAAQLTDPQAQAWKWLVAQPGGPAKALAISEEWSSDCRRDIPMLARIADVAGLELGIFPRDGQKFGRAPAPDPAESPNADLMARFLNEKNGQTWQSIPVIAFYDRDMKPLAHYIEFPSMYHKDRIVGAMRAPKPGENETMTRERGAREFMEMQQSPFFRVWASAAVDEWISMLYERLRVGSLA
ncbi:MAG: thioredoxin family protein [Candidatus Rokubacteria bacterium]|nr:thioredoxin family protein [Candidatus Rokubacteria bacterium]